MTRHVRGLLDAAKNYRTPRSYGYTGGLYTLRRGLENSINLVTAHLLDGGIEADPEKSLDEHLRARRGGADLRRMRPLLSVRARRAAGAHDRSRRLLCRRRQRRRAAAPHAHRSRSKQGGRTIYRTYAECAARRDRRRADRVAFYQLKTMLQGVVARGTARAIGALSPYVAGKTGTTEDEVDAWFVGFTNDVTIAVWVGYDNGDGKRRSLGRGQTGAQGGAPDLRADHPGGLGRSIAPKAPLSGALAGGAGASHRPADRLAPGEPRDRGGDAFVEHFRLDLLGRLDETQYRLVPREQAYASRYPGYGSDRRRQRRRLGRRASGPRRLRAGAGLARRSRHAAAAAGLAPADDAARGGTTRTRASGARGGSTPIIPGATRSTERSRTIPAFLAVAGARFCGRRVGAGVPPEGGRRGDRPRAGRDRSRGPIIFSDHKGDELADPGTGLDPLRGLGARPPAAEAAAGLHPGYVEPTVNVTLHGVTKPYKKKLHMYVAEARFVLPKAAALDRPSPLRDACRSCRRSTPRSAIARSRPPTRCRRRSRRRPTTATPTGAGARRRARSASTRTTTSKASCRWAIKLANKLEEGGKKIAEAIDFQSELRVLSGAEAAQPALMRLTGLDQPVAGALEQNLFFVNQIMSFGKLLAVFQPHPSDPGKTVVTALMALGVKSDVLEKKKEFERVPVLRNMVPAQVLVGNSSFNTGTSISAGLPKYVRNRIQAIAGILERE